MNNEVDQLAAMICEVAEMFRRLRKIAPDDWCAGRLPRGYFLAATQVKMMHDDVTAALRFEESRRLQGHNEELS